MAGFFDVAEDEITFNSFTKFSLFIFGLVKFDFAPRDENGSNKEKFLYNARLNFCRFTFLTIAFGIISIVIYAVQSTDFLVSSTCALNAIVLSQVALKTLTTFREKNKIWSIFQALKTLSENRSQSENEKYRIKSYLDGFLRTMKLYSLNIASGAFICVIPPLIQFIFFGMMEPAFQYWYPIDVFKLHTYPIALLWSDWVLLIVMAYSLAVDSLIYTLLTTIAMEFDILKKDFTEMFSDPSYKVKHPETARLVNRHIKLYAITDELQGIYSWNFLYNFVISSLIICFIAFQLTVADVNLAIYIFYISYLGVMMGQIFLLCMHGQKLINASVDMADGIYCSKWTDLAGPPVKKQMVLIMQQCQKGKRLTAMGFTDISFPTFTKILTTTMSYFSMLQTIYSSN